MDFNSVLNWLIPAVVIFIFIALLYNKMQEPVNKMFRWVASGIRWAFDRGSQAKEAQYTVVYRYG